NNNPWWHRTALRLLRERHDESVRGVLRDMLDNAKQDAVALRALWGLFAIGKFDQPAAQAALHHRSPWVRAWGVRLIGEAKSASANRLLKLALRDDAPEVRLQLAC